MATLSEYFRTEAREFLTALERSLQRPPGPDAAELHRAVRGLRGTAQMAREQRIFDVVSAFESVTRAIAEGALAWSDNVAARARDTIADLRVLLDPTEDDEQLDARVNEAAARWREAAPAPAAAPAAPVSDGSTADFREFAAREAAGIADTLDHGIQDLQADPMDREPLTAILRRQRALLGSARLDEIPVLADILRAVEDLTRVIVKLDVGAKKEWLDIYRVARDALQTTIAPLLRDELPEGSHSVSRLRHMREELLERYGSAVEQPPPPEDSLAPPTVSHPAAPFLSSASSAPAARPHDAARAPAAPPWQPGTPAGPENADASADAVVPTAERPQAGIAIPRGEAIGAGHNAVDDSYEADARARSRIPPAPDIAGPTAHSPAHGRDADIPAGHPRTGAADVADVAQDSEDVLELGEENIVGDETAGPEAVEAGVTGDDAVMDLDEASVIEADGAAPDFADDEGELLELDAGSVVDQSEDVLDLSEAGIEEESGDLVELADASVVEESEDVLELGDASVVEESDDVLELGDATVVEENGDVLELGDASVVDENYDVLELGDASVVDERENVPGPDAEAAVDGGEPDALRQRALELHEIVARATAHDPQARSALEELLTILRRALG
ncbi:MAG TPA: hypothetical protein VK912_11475 [Longimicrobiales bacterium]|nr:hypothetical protein [Longimicrobiales bacterium]